MTYVKNVISGQITVPSRSRSLWDMLSQWAKAATGLGLNLPDPAAPHPFSRNYFAFGGRRPGDRSHKRWKTARRGGRN